MIENYTLFGMLGICTIEDCKTKKLSLFPILMFGIVGLLLHMVFHNRSLYSMIEGAAIGVVLLGVSKITEGRIGTGDGLVLLVSGLYLGIEKNLLLFLSGLFLCGLWSILMLLLKKKKGSDLVPFVPFLFLAYFGMVLSGNTI